MLAKDIYAVDLGCKVSEYLEIVQKKNHIIFNFVRLFITFGCHENATVLACTKLVLPIEAI